MGIVPYDNQSSVGIIHRYRAFNGYRNYQRYSKMFVPGAYKMQHGEHEHGNDSIPRTYSSRDYETFKVLELRLKYFIHKRIELNAFLGFSQNKSKEDSLLINHTGFNDPSFFIGYHLFQPSSEKKWKQRLIAGAGFKIPSGNYYAADKNGKRLPFLMQPGTGSVDYFVYTTWLLGLKKWGAMCNMAYKINGQNYYKEKLGNSFTLNHSLFYKINIEKMSIIPNINGYYEYTSGLYVMNKKMKGTGMNEYMMGLGTDLFFGNLAINLTFQRTIFQKTESGNLRSAGRMVAGLTWNFNQRRYLINKRVKESTALSLYKLNIF